jgi:hypothetical protein
MFGQWLTRKYLEWQLEQGKHKTQGAFAKWLGINRGVLANYLNRGQKPEGLNVEKIADRLGDETYKVLGLASPDPLKSELRRLLPLLDPDDLQSLVAKAEAMARKKAKQ